ncbi:molybdenum cofactor biosynthesis protein MoeA [Intrasporangium oryzae NRRL B-24470]|uniref:Molybdopterin molybdenumtransferase n=1 Tax=Intrasporangium oryzae NRRL B-24470 TaxID=1386089 RepID=W9G1A6_9MICO|nr:gephyrin-like molybdotransferase Glp [Intrasporangium oryzae]EWS99724.1 molybdenum cofactor biosynthesis protein MoeA [Intrasporangium oryzae NRRL B-24470]
MTAAPRHRSVADHRAAVARLLGEGAVARMALDRHAVGLRLAADLAADDDLPRFDNSAMDGYAAHPRSGEDRTFVVVGDIPAGAAPTSGLSPGEAARVMTGARVPDGTVGVVPVEQSDASPTGPAPERVTFAGPVATGRHIRHRGEDVTAGAVIARAGDEVTPALIALGRSCGCTHIEVHVPTRVAVVATGAELSPPGTDPGPGGIHESNSEMVGALAAAAGCTVVRVETCSDETGAMRTLLGALDADPEVDVVITTGGVSAGAYEVVRQVCEPLGTFEFVHLAMQPGGPQGLGRYGSTPVVCLPGTPVGAFVAFRVLIRPALDARHGAPPARPGRAAYDGPTRHTRAGLVQFVTSVLGEDGVVRAPDARHLTALAAATCLIEVPEGVDQLIAGDEVTIHHV